MQRPVSIPSPCGFETLNSRAGSPCHARTTNRLVINYDYALPTVRRFNSFAWVPSRLSDGWQISGITTFQSGFPLDVFDSAYPSLTCAGAWYYACADEPNLLGSIQYTNPRTSPTNNWFSASSFAAPAPGTFGNAGRNLLRGPGINNFDFALLKDTRLTESTRLEMRFEFFNVLNHTQFNPAGILTDINFGPVFGQEFEAFSPRLIQLAAKFYF